MPPKKEKKPSAGRGKEKDDDADLDAVLEAAIRANEAVAGSPAALRLRQEQREAQERAAAEVEVAQQICGDCGAGGATLKCGSCAAVRYCGARCQKAHWPAHKTRCREMKVEAAAAAEAEAVRRDEEEEEVTFNPDTERGNCWNCEADNPHNMCNGCKVAKYCNEACQKENWPIHKGRCAQMKEDSAGFVSVKDKLKKVKAGVRKSQEELGKDLRHASLLGRVVDIERIIAAGGRVSAPDFRSGVQPIHGAAQEGHVRAIGVLIRHGAQVGARTKQGATASHMASQLGQLKAVVALLDHGGQVDARGNDGASSLTVASSFNHPEVAALLLKKGAHVDLQDNNGATPLFLAGQNGHVAMVRLLLQHGAQIDVKAKCGSSALYVASQNNHPEVVALLLEHGAQVDMQNIQGATPITIAASQGHTAVVRLLLEHGAKIDLPDNQGATPLIMAGVSGNVAMVRLLLQHGADPMHRMRNGGTVLDAATGEVVALLQEAGITRPTLDGR